MRLHSIAKICKLGADLGPVLEQLLDLTNTTGGALEAWEIRELIETGRITEAALPMIWEFLAGAMAIVGVIEDKELRREMQDLRSEIDGVTNVVAESQEGE